MVSVRLLICGLKVIFLSVCNMLNISNWLKSVFAFYVQESLKDQFLAH